MVFLSLEGQSKLNINRMFNKGAQDIKSHVEGVVSEKMDELCERISRL